MKSLRFFTQVLACLCFVAATFNAKASINLVAAGLALWSLTIVVP